ncbi:putative alpha beta-hydrolase [Lyophyllum shimeji]|uniref:acylaminoacyl-peptidase n=1 Tax=Lyophyllum shimeji TaxID=47721 RepID=A0A9P3PWR8_LYOSH|nr:putative alpha beta-hydrolase [Lyophyllum shimeji]
MYEQLTAIPVPSSASFAGSDVINVTSTFHDHVRNAKRTVSNSYVTEESVTGSALQDIGDEVAFTYSPSRARRAVLREVKTQGKTTRFVEIWQQNSIEASIEVTETHGPFYTDEFVGSQSFSSSETSLLYIAESNPPSASEEDPYRKFRYTPSFGEGIADKRRPAIFIFSWKNGPGKPSRTLFSLSTPPSALFGQAIFAPHADIIYATGYEYTSDHRLLGPKYCFNRPSGIWEITPTLSRDVMAGETQMHCTARKLTPSHLSCRSPRVFSHQGKLTLLWIAHPTGGAHAATSMLYSLDITSSPGLKELTSLAPLVDTVFTPENGAFPGLYPDFSFAPFPILRLSASKAPYLVTHSTWGSRTTVLRISMADGAVRDLTPEDGKIYSWKVLNTDGQSRVICIRSTPISPNELVLGQFDENGEVSWRVLHKPVLPPELAEELATLRASIIPIPDRYPIETIVIQSAVAPQTARDIRPCVTTPHGGPHATSTTAFSPATVALALERYTISLPNYTGSLGFGESAVRALLGKCGTLDVEDCIASVRHLIKLGISVEGPGKQLVMGGSHGGFLTGHLIGQYPDMFSAAVLRNPVTSAGEISTSDIPDWYYAEFGLPYPLYSSPSAAESESGTQFPQTSTKPPIMTPEVFERLHRASPIAHVDAVRAAVLLLVGTSDLRVAPTQGIEYYHALKQRAREGTPVEMLMFEGESHPLEGVEAARVGWYAGRDLFRWAETLVVQFPN